MGTIGNLKRMSVKEFIQLGLLQEVNRQILHPMGLSLSASFDENGCVVLDEVLDFRHIPFGIAFDDGYNLATFAESVNKMFEEKRESRVKKFGFHIQPPKK